MERLKTLEWHLITSLKHSEILRDKAKDEHKEFIFAYHSGAVNELKFFLETYFSK